MSDSEKILRIEENLRIEELLKKALEDADPDTELARIMSRGYPFNRLWRNINKLNNNDLKKDV